MIFGSRQFDPTIAGGDGVGFRFNTPPFDREPATHEAAPATLPGRGAGLPSKLLEAVEDYLPEGFPEPGNGVFVGAVDRTVAEEDGVKTIEITIDPEDKALGSLTSTKVLDSNEATLTVTTVIDTGDSAEEIDGVTIVSTVDRDDGSASLSVTKDNLVGIQESAEAATSWEKTETGFSAEISGTGFDGEEVSATVEGDREAGTITVTTGDGDVIVIDEPGDLADAVDLPEELEGLLESLPGPGKSPLPDTFAFGRLLPPDGPPAEEADGLDEGGTLAGTAFDNKLPLIFEGGAADAPGLADSDVYGTGPALPGLDLFGFVES